MNKLVHYFPNADLRAGYDGLSKAAAKDGVKLSELSSGAFVCFVNRKRDKLKLCTHSDMVAYLRLKTGERIDPKVIQHLPEFFNGGVIEYNRAMQKVLKQQFPKWFEKQGE
jgi:hypothetical protein